METAVKLRALRIKRSIPPVSKHGGESMNAIDSQNVLYSKGNNDECYTPDYGVSPILEFIPNGAVVWCPFDTEQSEFVKQIGQTNSVIHSHIDGGKDFYLYEPTEHWDIIVSNPPFTNKRGIFARALSFNKPFALLMSNTWLNDSAPKQLFSQKDLQLLMFDKRIKFITKTSTNDKITFSSSYFCWNLLPQQIVMRNIKMEKQKQSSLFGES
jgi:hypothetical protein